MFSPVLPSEKIPPKKEIGSAEEEAKRIVSDAIKSAEAKKKEVVLEGKDEIHRFRTESERKSPTVAKKFSVRNVVSNKRKKLLTANLTIWRKRKKRFPKSLRKPKQA